MEEKVVSLVSEHFGIPVSEINQELELRKDLNSTDLEIADFFLAIENAFRVTISLADAAGVHTVGDLITYIADHAEEVS